VRAESCRVVGVGVARFQRKEVAGSRGPEYRSWHVGVATTKHPRHDPSAVATGCTCGVCSLPAAMPWQALSCWQGTDPASETHYHHHPLPHPHLVRHSLTFRGQIFASPPPPPPPGPPGLSLNWVFSLSKRPISKAGTTLMQSGPSRLALQNSSLPPPTHLKRISSCHPHHHTCSLSHECVRVLSHSRTDSFTHVLQLSP